MKFLSDAWAIFKTELTLFQRFPKLRLSAIGVIVIPAVYALTYLSSVRDPAAHTGELKAAVVNLDQGLIYRGQDVNIGKDIAKSIKEKRTFNFVDVKDVNEAKLAVRQGKLSFALIIPYDFSANAVPGLEEAGGRLVMYASEGNNYNAANLAKRFASELGHQVNINLNEKRWSLVLTTATGSVDKLTQLRTGAFTLNEGAKKLTAVVVKAGTGSEALAKGADGLNSGVQQLTDGMKQLGGGLRSMDAQRPQPQDLAALKGGAAELVIGQAALGQGLQELHTNTGKLAAGSAKLYEETKGIPLVGGRIAESVDQLTDGAKQLGEGLQSAKNGQSQLVEGTQKLQASVGKLAEGVAVMGGGVHTAASKLPPDAKLDELATGSRSLAGSAQDLKKGLVQLQTGVKELSSGLNLLYTSLPASIDTPDGSARGLADSVEPALEMVASVPNNGAGFAPNFLATSLWLGAVMTAFIFHLRRLPLMAVSASNPAKLLGKVGILGSIVVAQAMVILLMSLFLLDLPVVKLLPYTLTLVTTSLTFLFIILALTRAFGDTGKAAALMLMVLQLSSAGGVLPVELSGGIYQTVSPYLPFTWVIKTLRASLFGAFDGDWFQPWLIIAMIGSISGLSAMFIGNWKYVTQDEHRPAMDV
jgi:putative membrane protein